MPDFYTAHQIASMLNVSLPTVYAWPRQLDFPSVKIGRTVRFPREEVISGSRLVGWARSMPVQNCNQDCDESWPEEA